MNIIEKTKSLLGEQKQYFKRYALTFIIIALTTLCMFFVGVESKSAGEFYVVMALTCVLVFITESFFDDKKYRTPLYVIAFLLAIGTKELFIEHNLTVYQILCIVGIYISIFILAIYKIINDTNLKLPEYLTRVFNNNIILGIASTILQMGLGFISLIITTLLLSNSGINVFLKAEILLFGLFVLPGEILCLLNVKNEPIKPIEVLICYIILPIVVISEIIIYMYFIKILILTEIPSNRIFPIISALFVFALPTWIMINSFKNKNKFFNIVSKAIPISFILLICMQIYAVGVRIIGYGITPERYLGIILIIFEIFTVVLSLIKEQKYLGKIIIVASILVFITMCVPGINLLDASWKSQLRRLTSVYKEGMSFEKLSEEDKEKAIGAYYYLKGDKYTEKHIPEYVKIDKPYKYIRNDWDNEKIVNEKTIVYNKEYENINIEGFKKLKFIEYNEYYYQKENMKINELSLYEFKISQAEGANKKIEEKIKEHLKECMEQDKNITETIIIDENNTFIITYLFLTYNKNDYSIENIAITGYMLMK